MRELILVEENNQIKGAFTSLPLMIDQELTLSPRETTDVVVDFKVNPLDNFTFDLRLTGELSEKIAMAGALINGIYRSGDYITIVLTNPTDKPIIIEGDDEFIDISFHKKTMIKAVKKVEGGVLVLDLNLNQ